jgi:hypothetical protein
MWTDKMAAAWYLYLPYSFIEITNKSTRAKFSKVNMEADYKQTYKFYAKYCLFISS